MRSVIQAIEICAVLVATTPVYAETRSLWLIKHSWHTGLAFAQEDLAPDVMPERADFAAKKYLEVGWGSREFYMAPDPGIWLGLKAGLIPGPSVLHVVGFDHAPAHEFARSTVEEREVPVEQFAAIVKYVDTSFDRQGATRAAALGPGLYGFSRFYSALGDYSLLYTCNDWLDDALAAGR